MDEKVQEDKVWMIKPTLNQSIICSTADSTSHVIGNHLSTLCHMLLSVCISVCMCVCVVRGGVMAIFVVDSYLSSSVNALVHAQLDSLASLRLTVHCSGSLLMPLTVLHLMYAHVLDRVCSSLWTCTCRDLCIFGLMLCINYYVFVLPVCTIHGRLHLSALLPCWKM